MFVISVMVRDYWWIFSVMKGVMKFIFDKFGVESIWLVIIVYGDSVFVWLCFDEEIIDIDELKWCIDNLLWNIGILDLNVVLKMV